MKIAYGLFLFYITGSVFGAAFHEASSGNPVAALLTCVTALALWFVTKFTDKEISKVC